MSHDEGAPSGLLLGDKGIVGNDDGGAVDC